MSIIAYERNHLDSAVIQLMPLDGKTLAYFSMETESQLQVSAYIQQNQHTRALISARNM